MKVKQNSPLQADSMQTTHLDLSYSNSMCRQSSMPTSILIVLFMGGGVPRICTHRSCSSTTLLAYDREIVARR